MGNSTSTNQLKVGHSKHKSTSSSDLMITSSHPVPKPEKKLNRSASGADVTEKYFSQLVPIEKLSEILKQKSVRFGINGIVSEVFVSQVFPQHPDLGECLFRFLHKTSKATTNHLGTIAFRQQCERFLGLMDDAKILESYIKMYAIEDNPDFVDKTGVTALLDICYTVAIQHSDNCVTCNKKSQTFCSVTDAIFFNNSILSIGYVCRWFEQNLIRLVLLVHKYCVHTLSTAYRGLAEGDQTCGIELQTPVLEKQNPLQHQLDNDEYLMPLSQAWLLAGALPPLYSRPQQMAAASINKSSAAHIFKQKLSMMPSHWTLLYNSNDDGLGVNRFLHHVLGYRGPTLLLIHVKNKHTYLLAAPQEWKESHLYTGGEDTCIIQLTPKFVILEKKSNSLYLNTTARGYPKGLRAGSDPKKPIISIDEHFEKLDIQGVAADLVSIEVWGCGDKSSRELQLDIKKWQIKEAERQRTVKLTAADWMDHPDRFLLELGGRQNYNN